MQKSEKIRRLWIEKAENHIKEIERRMNLLKQAIEFINNYSIDRGNHTVKTWKKLYAHLFTKFMDGNIKEARPVPENYKYVTPSVEQPGYGEEWYKFIIEETGDKFKVKGEDGN